MRSRKTILAVAATAAMFLTGAAPAAPAEDPLAGYPEGSELLADGAVAIPLAKEPPAWLTPELREKASVAAERGMGVDTETGALVSAEMATQYAFIRPGAWMLFPSWCTTAFVTGRPGDYEITTAGHCVSDGGEVILAAAPSLIFAIGEGSGKDGGVGNDFGKVKIRDEFQAFVDPDTAVVQGPGLAEGCGEFEGEATLTNPVGVKHFGHGVAVGTGGTPRTGVSTHANTRDPFLEGGFTDNAVYWSGAAAPGDSGSAVLTAGGPGCPLGAALAILTHLVVIGNNGHHIAGTPISKIGDVAVGNGLPI